MSRSRVVAAALLAAGAVAVLAIYALPLPERDAARTAAAPPASAAVPPANTAVACDLNVSPCAVALADGRQGLLALSPRPIPAAQALQVVWREPAGDAGAALPETVELAFEGVDMDMGFNRARLTRQADGSYAGNAMLPVCTTGSMRWRARVERGPQRDAASIEFTAPQRP